MCCQKQWSMQKKDTLETNNKLTSCNKFQSTKHLDETYKIRKHEKDRYASEYEQEARKAEPNKFNGKLERRRQSNKDSVDETHCPLAGLAHHLKKMRHNFKDVRRKTILYKTSVFVQRLCLLSLAAVI